MAKKKATVKLLERARAEGAPLIEGDQVTFVWHDAEGSANGVKPVLVGDFTNWAQTPIALKEEAPGVWAHTVRFAPDAYVEYAFAPADAVANEPDGLKPNRLTDPFNKKRIWNGINAYNHFLYMPGAKANKLTTRRRNVARGTTSKHEIDARGFTADRKRLLYLYQPPVSEPTPLLVVYDGSDYMNRAKLPVILDNLIAQGKVRPLSVAFIENGKDARTVEYMCNDATVAFLFERVLPFAREHLNLLDAAAEPGVHGIAGASMGGLMALYTGLRAPNTFGHVISQSGAFGFEPGGAESIIYDVVRRSTPTQKKLSLWLDVGTLEWLLEPNRKMLKTLRDYKFKVNYEEYNAGHNYTAWSNALPRALQAVYGVRRARGRVKS